MDGKEQRREIEHLLVVTVRPILRPFAAAFEGLKRYPKTARASLTVLLFILLFLIVATIWLTLMFAGVLAWDFTVNRYIQFTSAQGYAAAFIIVGGTGLYWFRCRRLFLYGIFEILLGFFSAIFGINRAAGVKLPDDAVLFGSAAALYI